MVRAFGEASVAPWVGRTPEDYDEEAEYDDVPMDCEDWDPEDAYYEEAEEEEG